MKLRFEYVCIVIICLSLAYGVPASFIYTDFLEKQISLLKERRVLLVDKIRLLKEKRDLQEDKMQLKKVIRILLKEEATVLEENPTVLENIPVIISLEADSVKSSSRKADSLVLFQILHHGPNAQAPIIKNMKETTSSEMLAFLDRIPPPKSSKIYIKPKNEKIEIWKHNNKYFIRTSEELIWPAWNSVINGAGSTKCYEVPITPRILMSKNGNIYTTILKEKNF